MERHHNYISGSTAKKLNSYDVYEENEVLKERKKYKDNRKIKLKSVVYILIVFAACFVVTYRFALITELNYSINKTESQYANLRNENSQIREQVEIQTDLDNIKLVAETKLGMQKPDKSQIVYIKIPKEDYSVVMNTSTKDKNAGNGNLFAGIFNWVSGIANLSN